MLSRRLLVLTEEVDCIFRGAQKSFAEVFPSTSSNLTTSLAGHGASVFAGIKRSQGTSVTAAVVSFATSGLQAGAAHAGANSLAFTLQAVATTNTFAAAFATVFASFAFGASLATVLLTFGALFLAKSTVIFAHVLALALLTATLASLVTLGHVALTNVIAMRSTGCALLGNGGCILAGVLAAFFVFLHCLERRAVQLVALPISGGGSARRHTKKNQSCCKNPSFHSSLLFCGTQNVIGSKPFVGNAALTYKMNANTFI